MADEEERTLVMIRAPAPVPGAELADLRYFGVVVDGSEPGRRVVLDNP